ncbi:DUF6801 domain-containing protein [Kitasatospora sp. NPDC088346]|uniref:DUF6801 domain-containing protein n=1 Tax=Kitasatospora sp. NPDC088346 TaxID=3364073 RepID=UPI0037FA2E08
MSDAARRRRRPARPAAVAAAVLLLGLVPGGSSVADGAAPPVPVAYGCATPGGAVPVTVAVAQRYPARAEVDRPFQPGAATVTVTVPQASLAALLPAGTASVAGRAALAVTVAQGTSSAEARWPELRTASAPVPATGDLVLTGEGLTTRVTVTAPGPVVFTLTTLTLDLRPAPTTAATGATAADPAPGGAAAPGAVCTPGPDVAPLGTVQVPGQGSASPSQASPSQAPPSQASPSSASPSPSAAPDAPPVTTPPAATPPAVTTPPAGPGAARPNGATLPHVQLGRLPGRAVRRGTVRVEPAEHSGVNTCPPAPTGALDPARLPPVPAGATVIPFPDAEPFPDVPACAFAVGYANVHKLRQAAVVNDPGRGPALAALNLTRRFVTLWDPEPGQQPYLEADSLGYLKLPPSDTTFLTYGFIPTTAKMELLPLGPLTIVATGNSDWDQPVEFTIGGHQTLRLYDVKINGTPLDVGPDCRTVTPVDLRLTGRQDDYLPDGGDGKPDYTLQTGGPLAQRDLTIPPFAGCRNGGEDLDALFTAAVSGPGNSLNLVQGAICTPTSDQPNGCEPEIELPALPHRR